MTIHAMALVAPHYAADSIDPEDEFGPLPDALPDNTVLHEFLIIGVLSTGGFSIAYESYSPSLEISVVIKEYFPTDRAVRRPPYEVIARGSDRKVAFERAKKRFAKEAHALARMKHPNIVHVYDQFEANGTVYLVLEKVDGITLRKWMGSQGPAGPKLSDVQHIFRQLVSALDHAHSKGIVHCDVKPENVIIKPDGTLVLIDFGGWRRDGLRDSIGTFTPFYSPPEFFDPNAKASAGFDIYGLAATLHEIITGAPPPMATVRTAVDRDPYKPLAAVMAGSKWPAALLASIDKALTINPTKRHVSISAFADAALGIGTEGPGTPPDHTDRPLVTALSSVALFVALTLVGMLISLIGITLPATAATALAIAKALVLLPVLQFLSLRVNKWAPLLVAVLIGAATLATTLHPNIGPWITSGTVALTVGLAALMVQKGRRVTAENLNDAV